MAIARSMPRSVPALAAVEDMPQGLVRRAGDELVQRTARAAQDASRQPPVAILQPLSGDQRALVSILSDRLKQIADSLEIPPEVLMPKADLEQLIRLEVDATLSAPDSWSGWRADIVVEPLRQALRRQARS
jgi:ribonuclease D